MINLHHIDCMEFMKGLPDKAYDLAIVDPPYGIGEDGSKSNARRVKSDKWRNPKTSIYKNGGWDKSQMNFEYFNELKRVSKNQIIWGANHFISMIPYNSPCWIVWDKKDGKDNSDFADCELAYTSFNKSVRLFKMYWLGWGAINAKEIRIHPTQKPVALYKWLLKNYATSGNRILDTHGGSMSIAIACYDLGFDLDLCELDPDYFRDGQKRLDDHIAKYAPANEKPINALGQHKLF